MPKDPLQMALHFLKFRPRSVFEVEQKLKQKGIIESEIKKVIAVLKKNKLLDDEKFAKMWVESRNNLRPSGSYVLKMELRRFGISDDIIEDILTPQPFDDAQGKQDEVLARKALEGKARYRNADFEKKAAFLARRGFKMSVIYKVLKNNKAHPTSLL